MVLTILLNNWPGLLWIGSLDSPLSRPMSSTTNIRSAFSLPKPNPPTVSHKFSLIGSDWGWEVCTFSNNLSLAQLDLSANALAGTVPALTVGDNRGVTAFQNLAELQITFNAAGNVTETTKTLQEYAAIILSDLSIKAEEAESRYEDSSALKAELSARVKNDSGVNIDEELANMILFQNAFNASARLVATTREMFDELLSIVR